MDCIIINVHITQTFGSTEEFNDSVVEGAFDTLQ